jgi:Arc/MetJ-type ribon-helix-helix transcriptional regulator
LPGSEAALSARIPWYDWLTGKVVDMQVDLKPAIQRFVDEQVKAGSFANAQDVLEAGVARLMLDPAPDDLDADDLAAIEESEEQIRRGESLEWRGVSAQLRNEYKYACRPHSHTSSAFHLARCGTFVASSIRSASTPCKMRRQ